MDSYFFVPGSRLNKIDAIKSLGVDHIIIDLEDAIRASEIAAIVNKLESSAEQFVNCYIRVPLLDENMNVDTDLLVKLQKIGFNRFVFPKLNTAADFKKVVPKLKINDQLQILLLVESPSLLLECKELLEEFKGLFIGIGLGSHDFMAVVGGKHMLANLEFARQQLLYIARAANIEAIDIASMELENAEALEYEIKDGFDKGYDGKFIIHPWQLALLQGIDFYSEKEYQWALKINKLISEAGVLDEFNAIKVGGQVIEKPHWNRVQKILKFYKKL